MKKKIKLNVGPHVKHIQVERQDCMLMIESPLSENLTNWSEIIVVYRQNNTTIMSY